MICHESQCDFKAHEILTFPISRSTAFYCVHLLCNFISLRETVVNRFEYFILVNCLSAVIIARSHSAGVFIKQEYANIKPWILCDCTVFLNDTNALAAVISTMVQIQCNEYLIKKHYKIQPFVLPPDW